LEPGEIVRQVCFPVPLTAGYAKFPNPASRYAVVGAFVARTANGVRVAITGAGPSVFRVPQMEAALTASFSSAAIAGITVPADELNTDPHASADYRAHLIGVMTARAITFALESNVGEH
jgi:carbon-monoxide dehydrogenase medium subunit